MFLKEEMPEIDDFKRKKKFWFYRKIILKSF